MRSLLNPLSIPLGIEAMGLSFAAARGGESAGGQRLRGLDALGTGRYSPCVSATSVVQT